MNELDNLQAPVNRPGLPELSYRLGDYASFRSRLVNRLIRLLKPSSEAPSVSLQKLTTRATDDPAIALLDACAIVADVLTFYQERIINEGYILTATERRSVVELARMIGYELDPGVAASTDLAFTVDDAPDSPKIVTIPKGTQIMSVPVKDELPQTFETIAEFVAHVDWNSLKPRPTRAQPITPNTRSLYLDGIATQLQPGDPVLLMDDDREEKNFHLLIVDTVQPNTLFNNTLITWKQQFPPQIAKPPLNPILLAFRQQVHLFGNSAPRWEDMPTEIKLANGGKPKGGVYRFQGVEWEPVSKGLSSLEVRCVAVNAQKGYLFAGTASGMFRSKDNGETWTAINSGLNNLNVQTISVTDSQILVGTPASDVFRSTDDGESWSSIGIGRIETIRSGLITTTAAKPTPNTVVRALTTLLQGGKSYILAGTDDGVYRTEDQGSNWNLVENTNTILPKQPIRTVTTLADKLFARTDREIYRSGDQGKTWEIKALSNNTAALSLIADLTQTKLFAGSADGVYETSDNGDHWNLIADSPKTVRSIAINPDDRTLYAANSEGIFRFKNNQWQKITTNATVIDSVSIAAYTKDNVEKIFIGSPFTGFRNDNWIDFQIQTPIAGTQQEIDLDTLYPRILIDSWIVLQNQDQFQTCKIIDITTVQRSAFTLNTQITRMTIDTIIDQPQKFDLRNTIVLAQSEILAIAQIPLTVPVQQAQIFFDPIWKNKIFLSQYVVGLRSQQKIIVSGKYIRAEIKNIGGVAKLNQEWSRLNNGLTNTQVTSVAFTNDSFFVGTDGGGVFRSTNRGETWKPMNRDLENLQIQTLVFKPDAQQPLKGCLFAGTAGSGIFRTCTGDRWESVNKNLVYLDVRSLLLKANGELLAGTVDGGIFRLPSAGKSWLPTGLDNTDVQALLNFSENDILAGTIRDGVFYSTDGGTTWSPLNPGLTELNITNITALVTYSRSGSGTIQSQAAQVIGQGTKFRDEFTSGGWIQVGDQIRRVTKISSDTRLEIDRAFDRDLTSETEFKVVLVFAGTAGSGIFRLESRLNSEGVCSLQWATIASNPTDLNIRCFAIANSQLFVGTFTGGVFQSIDNGDRWTPINTGLTSADPEAKVNTDIRALAIFQNQLFAAGEGILISPDQLYTVPIQVSDRLQVLQPPEPLLQEQTEKTQKWLLKDRNGFIGNIITVAPDEIHLEPALVDDEVISESHMILIPPTNQQEPVLFLIESVRNSFDPTTVEIYANVVPATHGETISEVLGSGDGTTTNQQFLLQKPPVTYITAPTPRGSQSTLQVRVNEILWQEVQSLYQHQPQEEIYTTHIADDGTTTITFGNGKSGSRLPTGIENLVATYRSGIGLAGQVGAAQLSLLKTRPLGISQVINPLPATGAADPEKMAEAKTSAPLTTRTLDRVVSFQDYEDFARSFVGIGKAKAIVLWTEGIQQIHITVAAVNGKAVATNTALYTSLVNGIENARDPGQPMQIDSYELLRFNLDAKLLIDPRYLAEKVIAQVQNALMTRFRFERRDFGQPVTAAEAIATIQAIAGIIAVDLDALHRLDRARSLEQSLVALSARWDAQRQKILPAQLLLINLAGIRLSVEVSL